MTSPNRIWFSGNPWPEGHPIEHLVWTGRIEADGLYFDLDLRSANYYAERDVESEADESWKSSLVWGNYHRCSLSSTKWGPDEGIFVGDEEDPFDWNELAEWVFDVDMGKDTDDHDNHAFHIYLLGHDSVLRHHVRFTEPRGRTHRLRWKARIALTYVGDYELKHRLEVDADVTFEGFRAAKNIENPREQLVSFTKGETRYTKRRDAFLPV